MRRCQEPALITEVSNWQDILSRPLQQKNQVYRIHQILFSTSSISIMSPAVKLNAEPNLDISFQGMY